MPLPYEATRCPIAPYNETQTACLGQQGGRGTPPLLLIPCDSPPLPCPPSWPPGPSWVSAGATSAAWSAAPRTAHPPASWLSSQAAFSEGAALSLPQVALSLPASLCSYPVCSSQQQFLLVCNLNVSSRGTLLIAHPLIPPRSLYLALYKYLLEKPSKYRRTCEHMGVCINKSLCLYLLPICLIDTNTCVCVCVDIYLLGILTAVAVIARRVHFSRGAASILAVSHRRL